MNDFEKRAKEELVEAGKDVGRGLVKELVSWIKSKPIRRLIAKRRAAKQGK